MSGLARASRAPSPNAENADFLEAVLDGLGLPQKRIPPKYFYDEHGSRLFDAICALEEYYPTLTETGILRGRAPELARHVPEGSALVELGSGSSVKTRILLDALPALRTYVPVDISAEHLAGAAERLDAAYPNLAVTPLAADFTETLALPCELEDTPKLLFFPGSTIGNFSIPEAQAMLARLRTLPATCGLVIGVDLRKNVGVLLRAYDDASGVTAAFNLNLLARINRELGGDFDLASFRHQARWNDRDSRIEMHLVSRRRQRVTVGGRSFAFAEGESIHTEDSHKFSVPEFQAMAERAQWRPAEAWTDPDGLFSVHLLLP